MPHEYGIAQQFAVAASDSASRRMNRIGRGYLEVYAVGAAIIELMTEEKILMDAKGNLVRNDPAPSVNPGLDQLADTIGNTRKPKSMKTWIKYFYYRSKERRAIASKLLEPLFRDGTLRLVKHKALWIFPYYRYSADAAAKDRIIQRLRAEMLEPGAVTVQIAVLAMLLEAVKLLKFYFSSYERQELRVKMERLQAEQAAEWRTIILIKRAVQEIEASASAGAVAATAATTS